MSDEPGAESGEKPALVWKRGRFVVRQFDLGSEVPRFQEVSGVVAGAFGIFRSIDYFQLVHIPTGFVLTDLAKQKHCRALAGELNRLRIHWGSSVPEEVQGEDTKILQATINRHRRASFSWLAGVHG